MTTSTLDSRVSAIEQNMQKMESNLTETLKKSIKALFSKMQQSVVSPLPAQPPGGILVKGQNE